MNKRILGMKGLSGVMEGLLRFLFFGGMAITVSLPFTLRLVLPYLYYGPIPEWLYRRALLFLMPFGVLMVLFVHFAARVFRTIKLGDPFILDNLRSLSVMAVLSFGLCATCAYYAFGGHSIPAAVLTLFFLFFAAFLLVLREVFRAAIAFKEENDFTI